MSRTALLMLAPAATLCLALVLVPDPAGPTPRTRTSASQVEVTGLPRLVDRIPEAPGAGPLEPTPSAGTASPEDLLSTLRQSADPFEQRVAIFTLWNTRELDDAAIDTILGVLEGATDEGLICQAIHALKDSPRADVGALTQRYLSTSPSAAVRLKAAKALHFRKGSDVTRSLGAQLLVEGDADVRTRLLFALGTRAIEDLAARAALEQAARFGADEELRARAKEQLDRSVAFAEQLSR